MVKKPSHWTILRAILSLGISLLAVLVVAVGLLVTLTPNKPVRLLIVRSGSMEPTLPVGSLVVSKRAADYRPGDIVTILHQGRFVTHRIVEKQPGGYVTKGDANNVRDGGLVLPSEIRGKVWFVVPWIGKWSSFVKTPFGYAIGVLLPAAAIIANEVLVIIREVRKKRPRPPSRTKRGERVTVSRSVRSRSARLKHPVVASVKVHALRTRTRVTRRKRRLSPDWRYRVGPVVAGLCLMVSVVAGTSAHYTDTGISSGNRFTTKGAPLAGGLVINEFLYHSSCNNADAKQWIELWNGSDHPIDLNHWRVKEIQNDVTGVIHAHATIEPGEFVMLSRSGGVFSFACYGRPPADRLHINLGSNREFNTVAGILQLIDPDGVVVDRVEYGGPGQPSAPVDQSIERIQLGFDTAAGDTFAPTDFETRFPITPGFARSAAPTVVLNEFRVQPVTKQFIEIYNPTATDQDVSQWAIRLENFRVVIPLPEGTVIPAGQRKTMKLFTFRGDLGDTIYLTNSAGAIMDAFNYHRFVPPAEQSWARIPDGTNAWQLDISPTPNAVNQ